MPDVMESIESLNKNMKLEIKKNDERFKKVDEDMKNMKKEFNDKFD